MNKITVNISINDARAMSDHATILICFKYGAFSAVGLLLMKLSIIFSIIIPAAMAQTDTIHIMNISPELIELYRSIFDKREKKLNPIFNIIKDGIK